MKIVAMPEKRQGKVIVRFYAPEELHELFKEWCDYADTNMTTEFKALMQRCIDDPNFQEYLQVKRRLRSGEPPEN